MPPTTLNSEEPLYLRLRHASWRIHRYNPHSYSSALGQTTRGRRSLEPHTPFLSPRYRANRHSFILSFSFSAMLKIFKAIDFIYLINMLRKIKIFT